MSGPEQRNIGGTDVPHVPQWRMPWGGRQDGLKLAPETISCIKHMVKDDAESSKVCMGYKLEPGLPCQHKALNWYICDGATLKEIHAAMVADLEANPAEGVRAPSCGSLRHYFNQRFSPIVSADPPHSARVPRCHCCTC